MNQLEAASACRGGGSIDSLLIGNAPTRIAPNLSLHGERSEGRCDRRACLWHAGRCAAAPGAVPRAPTGLGRLRIDACDSRCTPGEPSRLPSGANPVPAPPSAAAVAAPVSKLLLKPPGLQAWLAEPAHCARLQLRFLSSLPARQWDGGEAAGGTAQVSGRPAFLRCAGVLTEPSRDTVYSQSRAHFSTLPACSL